MPTTLIRYICPVCGGVLDTAGENAFKCRSCGSVWEKERIDDYNKILEKFDFALREQRQEDLAKLARRRYEEVTKKFVSNEAVKEICNKILDLNPDDVYSRFFLATCKEDYDLVRFLNTLDVEKNYNYIGFMLDYLIPALRVRWINAVSNLIENAYKSKDVHKYDSYRTRFEAMAEAVENGIFEPDLPRDIFIAYSSNDMEQVDELLHILEDENELSCFVAARNLRHGSGAVENYWRNIHTAMCNCKAVVFISSCSSRSFRCDTKQELTYIKENLPDMWRIELLAEKHRGNAAERFFTGFFEGLEYCTSADEVAVRYFDKCDEEMRAQARKEAETEEAIKRKAAETRQKIEEETRRKLEAEYAAKFQAEAEARRKAEAEAEVRRKLEAEAEAKRKAEAEAKRREEEEALADFEIENGVLKKYKGEAENVVIPSSVTAIGEEAFYPGFLNNSNLESVTIPNSVKSIGKLAFWNCTSLIRINITSSITSIGERAFCDCGSLESITVDKANANYHIAGNCLIETKSKTLIRGCKNSIIPSDGSVTSIGEFAFSNCESLTSIEIPSSVITIDFSAFSGCSSLTSITIPSSVTSIHREVFSGCTNLKKIYCGARTQPADWDKDWLGTYSKCHAEVVWGYGEAKEASASPLSDFKIENGVLKKYIGKAEKVVIPKSITEIGEKAFEDCDTVKSVTIPYGFKRINKYAFYWCTNLASIDIPNSVTSIGDSAFWYCSSLTSISIPSSVTRIDADAFNGCENLKTIYCGARRQPEGYDKDWLGAYTKCPAEVIWGRER